MKHQFLNEETGTVTILDDRYYLSDIKPVYYPSVTTVLDAYPKGFGYINWLKQVSYNADIIVKKAAEDGTLIHDLIEQYTSGKQLTWYINGIPQYDFIVWQMLLRFVEFWQTCKPKILATELKLVSDKYEIGGRLDLVCVINGETWLIDYKSANAIYRSYDLQTAAYAVMWNERNETQIDRTGIMWLKAVTRGPDKAGKKIQGEGWQVVEPKAHYTEDFKVFQKVADIWRDANTINPNNLTLPNTILL